MEASDWKAVKRLFDWHHSTADHRPVQAWRWCEAARCNAVWPGPGPGPGSILIITVGRRRPPPGTNIIATKLHRVISLLMPTPETIYSHDYCPAENTNHIKDTTIDDCKMSERASINVDYVGRSLVHIRHIHDLLLLSTRPNTLVTIWYLPQTNLSHHC